MTINTSKGAVFDTLLLSLVVPIPEQPRAEVWNSKNAWLSGQTAGLLRWGRSGGGAPGLGSCLRGVAVHCFTLKVLMTLMEGFCWALCGTSEPELAAVLQCRGLNGNYSHRWFLIFVDCRPGIWREDINTCANQKSSVYILAFKPFHH